MKPFTPLISVLIAIILSSSNPDTTPTIHFVADKDTIPQSYNHGDTTKIPMFFLNIFDSVYDFVFIDSNSIVLSYGGKYGEKKKLYIRDSLAAIKCVIGEYFRMNKMYLSADSARRVLIQEKLNMFQTSYKTPL